MRDLAPSINRQRLVLEGTPREAITDQDIRDYLSKLSETIQMRTLLEPVTNYCKSYGWAGWIHWETSGAHFYAWERPHLFFSVDIYACKPFSVASAVDFTCEFFGLDEVEFGEF